MREVPNPELRIFRAHQGLSARRREAGNFVESLLYSTIPTTETEIGREAKGNRAKGGGQEDRRTVYRDSSS